jgi:hypothetical protein
MCGHELAPDYLKPLLRPELRSLRPVPDLPQPGVHPPNHLHGVPDNALRDPRRGNEPERADGIHVGEACCSSIEKFVGHCRDKTKPAGTL